MNQWKLCPWNDWGLCKEHPDKKLEKFLILFYLILFGGVFLKKISVVILVCLIAVGVVLVSGCSISDSDGSDSDGGDSDGGDISYSYGSPLFSENICVHAGVGGKNKQLNYYLPGRYVK